MIGEHCQFGPILARHSSLVRMPLMPYRRSKTQNLSQLEVEDSRPYRSSLKAVRIACISRSRVRTKRRFCGCFGKQTQNEKPYEGFRRMHSSLRSRLCRFRTASAFLGM